MNSLLDYDYGPRFNYLDNSGIIDNVPPTVKQAIPTLAIPVDADGNEVASAGLHSALAQMPLGTYTGWNPIASGIFKGQEQNLAGGYVPFPKTRAERIATGDPRLSIEERYPNFWVYYYGLDAVIQNLVNQRYLLPQDAARTFQRALSDILSNNLLPVKGTLVLPDGTVYRDE
jgi:hypothetical protein